MKEGSPLNSSGGSTPLLPLTSSAVDSGRGQSRRRRPWFKGDFSGSRSYGSFPYCARRVALGGEDRGGWRTDGQSVAEAKKKERSFSKVVSQ